MTIEEWEELDAEEKVDILMDMIHDMPCSFSDLIADIPSPREDRE